MSTLPRQVRRLLSLRGNDGLTDAERALDVHAFERLGELATQDLERVRPKSDPDRIITNTTPCTECGTPIGKDCKHVTDTA